MIEHLRELSHYRGLLAEIVTRDIKVKYKQSIMGFMWAILMPLLIVLVGVIVRLAFSVAGETKIDFSEIVGVAIRSVPYAFTVASIREATNCLMRNPALVTKIYFPKEIFPLAAVGANLFDLCIASVPLIILVVIGGGQLSAQLLWVPILLIILIVIVSAIGFIVSAASLFFRDVKYLVEVLLTFGIFFTPVFFNVSLFGRYSVLMMLNPLSSILEGMEASIMRAEPPDMFWLSYSLIFGLVTLALGYSFFKRVEPAFAESI